MATAQHEPAGVAAGFDPHAEPDWEAIERSPEFQRLVSARRRFVIPATIFFLTWYFGFILLAGYAEGLMGRSIYQGLTVGYVLALSQFVMTWGLGWMYLRRADREFEPLSEAVVESARRSGAAPAAEAPQAERSPMGISRPGAEAPAGVAAHEAGERR